MGSTKMARMFTLSNKKKDMTLKSKLVSAAVIVTVGASIIVSCNPVDPENGGGNKGKDTTSTSVDSTERAKKYLRSEYMNYYYYWMDSVKTRNMKLDQSRYDIYDFFDAMLYGRDRWSWMCDAQYYIGSESGVVEGTYGATIAQPLEYHDDYDILVSYVYPGSPFAEQGVTRGWTLTHINGVPTMSLIANGTFSEQYAKSPQNFTFKDTEGKDHNFTATAATELSTRSSLETKIFTDEDFPGLTEPVGYFNYLSFKANFLSDISKAMESFRFAGIKTLILDLRYNGGGDSRASQLLVNYLAPESARGQVYVSRVHNRILASENESEMVGAVVADPVTNKNIDAKSIGIERLYVITGSRSASASEMCINGLRPLMDVKMVGDTTYGKPNGMYVLMYPGEEKDYRRYNAGDLSGLEWVFLPICFYNMNGKYEAIPDDGFIPDNYRPDDLYHDFNAEEDNIKACLTHIVTGSFPSLPEKHGYTTRGVSGRKVPGLDPSENNPHYGLYTVMPDFDNNF